VGEWFGDGERSESSRFGDGERWWRLVVEGNHVLVLGAG
jgi:hypothetical protein